MGRVTARRRAHHVTADDATARAETLVVEEPLEIRVNGKPITVTMRTPGSDIELAQGFLLTEGVIAQRDDVLTARYCGGTEDGANTYNVLDVTLAPGVDMPDVDVTRNFYTTSSCGICGKASLDAVRLISRHCPGDDPSTVAAQTLSAMPEKLRAAQKVFARTGGLHGAALFACDGTTLAVREDIGRHNAVDKVIGWALEGYRIPLTGTVLLVSGRASFELTQKAVMAGIPVLAALSAPSSLAVDLASQSGLTLVAFLRGGLHERLHPPRPGPALIPTRNLHPISTRPPSSAACDRRASSPCQKSSLPRCRRSATSRHCSTSRRVWSTAATASRFSAQRSTPPRSGGSAPPRT